MTGWSRLSAARLLAPGAFVSHSSEHGDESTVQRAELRARAEQLESAGERPQAVAVYEQLVALDRRASMPLLKIADLQLKLECVAPAPAAEPSEDDAADAIGEGAASPQRPAPRRRRAALSGAISSKRRPKGR